MLCSFVPYSKVKQLYVHIYPLSLGFLCSGSSRTELVPEQTASPLSHTELFPLPSLLTCFEPGMPRRDNVMWPAPSKSSLLTDTAVTGEITQQAVTAL